ncbi:ABC transporter ATP-binding protein [Xanthomarina gelatinilytica]|uniref:ABC transporter ATP-binding protein n=1 Tax=Xanthomarina gelatinilytica TaxID=1137281 RepID=UPI003AA922E8
MLQVKNMSFGYHKKPILKNIDFQVDKGEHLSIIGESGSGKSTLLKLLYGELDANEGSILWKDTEILGPKHNLIVGYDFMKYVAQEFDLMPFITVAENIGKHLSNFYPEKKRERIKELLEVVELTEFSNIKVKFLSGGQKQRVALARALANQPEILLLDEPFSHIDNFKKRSLRRKLFHYLKANNIACIVASHDHEDVLPYADRMLVLNKAKIVANNTPEHLYKHPKTPLIASFFGEFNVIDGKIVYAHQLKIVDKSNIKATVKKSYFKGASYLIEADLNGNSIFIENEEPIEINKEIYLITKQTQP